MVSVALSGARRRSKYGATRATRDGFSFDSQLEARVYDTLVLLQHAGEVEYFLCQVPFRIPGGVKYVADFLVLYTDGRKRVLDAKGVETATYKTKKKLVEHHYPITIEKITSRRGRLVGL